MIETRRSFLGQFLPLAALGPVLAPGLAAGQTNGQTLVSLASPAPAVPPAGAVDPVALLRAASPANARERTALDRTLARLDDLNIFFGDGPLILVNIAAQQAMAYEHGREVLRSKVIVGAPRTRTPQLATFVTGVRSNPPWYVPASITAEILAGGAVGYQNIRGRLIQPPGPRNPLGPLRIGLESSDGIFLHGTNDPRLFGRATRTFSHGCIRVERVFDLAAWILGCEPGELRSLVANGRTTDQLPPQETPVFVAYLTAWPEPDGRIGYFADPYGHDAPGSRGPVTHRALPPELGMEAAARTAEQGDSRL